jgi:hypothetical protein
MVTPLVLPVVAVPLVTINSTCTELPPASASDAET